MADITLTLTIPNAKVAVATERYFALFPNTELVNPEDTQSGLKYTTKQWVEETLRRYLVGVIHRGKVVLERAAAKTVVDDTMATRS